VRGVLPTPGASVAKDGGAELLVHQDAGFCLGHATRNRSLKAVINHLFGGRNLRGLFRTERALPTEHSGFKRAAMIKGLDVKWSVKTPMGKRIKTIPREVMDILKLYDWPGNIRERQNIIKRAVIMSTGPALRPLLGEFKRLPGQTSPAAARTLAEAERDHIVEVLGDTRWVLGGVKGAAARLGMPRTTLVYKMRKLGIVREQGCRPFRGRLSGLPDSPTEFSPDQREPQMDSSEATIAKAFSKIGTA
jgi:hypothetical protein